jgi:hypothetical protein
LGASFAVHKNKKINLYDELVTEIDRNAKREGIPTEIHLKEILGDGLNSAFDRYAQYLIEQHKDKF